VGPIEPAATTAAALLATDALQAASGQADQPAWAGMSRLAALVRDRVRGHRQAEAALTLLKQHPQNADRVRELSELLAAFAAQDAAFQRDLTGLVAEAKQDPAIGAFATQVDGQARVGSIINLAQVQGGVHFHLAPAPPEPLPASPADRPRLATALPGIWNVPYRRNPDFTGREELLSTLADRLAGGGTAAVTQVLQGGGGVGKTSLAVEYAYRHRSRLDAVWWVRAEEPATLVDDHADLAIALGLAEAGQADQQLAVQAVRRWLDDHDRWLLVLDNAEDPEAPTGLRPPLARLVDLLPQVVHGQLLVTSRDASWERYAPLAELEVFTPKEAVTFLLARSGSGDRATATEIAGLLGWLPLALEQAGAYVGETRLPLATYLERLRQFPALTVAKGRPRDRDPADTVATTWQVSIERVRPIPGAVELLGICAFLGPEEIPRALFSQPLDPVPDEVAVLAGDPFALDEAVGGLRRFGLVKADEQAVTVHRLVQAVVRRGLDRQGRQRWTQAAVRLVLAGFPDQPDDVAAWPTAARLLPHALAVTDHANAQGADSALVGQLLNRTAAYLRRRARFAQARALFERALAINQAVLGPEHPDVAASLDHLGDVLYALRELPTARQAHERALAIRVKQLGPDHPDTARTVDLLGNVLRGLGEWPAARAHYDRALAIRRSQLGPEHPDTAQSLEHLGLALHGLGDLARARQAQEQALAIREAQLGADHSHTAWSRNNLGTVLADQGDLAKGRELLEQALAVREVRLGPDHPETAWNLHNLAKVLRAQGDLDAARGLHERALRIREARLGPDHPDTAHSLHNLADLLRVQGDLDRARGMLERALAIREARLGADHRLTMRSRRDLAAVVAELDENQ
jgi:tetratricopeptide (TPR) repeat protein